MNDMQEKIGIVTGASSGIGKEIAFGLARAGMHVVLVCRNAAKGQMVLDEIKAITHSQKVDLLLADLSSQSEVISLSQKIHARYPVVHVLINNAGVVLTQKEYSVDGIEMTLATNYLGPFLLTNLLLDLLASGAPSRVINISSAIHRWASLDLDDLQFERRKYQFMKAYAQSKLLMNISTFELARRMKDTNVTVNCIHPGAVKTHLGSDSATNFILKAFDRIIKSFFMTPQAAAKAPLYLALSPAVEGVTGGYFLKSKPAVAKRIAYDKDIASRLWERSEKILAHQCLKKFPA